MNGKFKPKNSEGNRPLGRCRHRWEDNITLDLEEIGCELDLGGSG
jgi:hypothetical protein